jgi:uncharacterized membrane protein (Fun14 family)
MIEEKKAKDSQMTKFAKVKRNFMRIVIGLIIIGIVWLRFKGVIY